MESKLTIISIILIIAVVSVIAINQLSISGMATNISKLSATKTNVVATAPKILEYSVAPKGVPEIYGEELDIRYDDVSSAIPEKAESTIKKLGNFDNKISLTGDKKNRYIKIASQISCEYCCGADSIIFPDGRAACGCAHSFAMRGLAKYLLDKHADEYTDDQILEELGKWKTLFFPSPMEKKAEVLTSRGIEINYINLASNKYRGIENG